jgi:ubiquinone/menaquinone biosynthesis C-methylase UbiE
MGLIPHAFIASQLRQPSGRFGRMIIARLLNRSNASLNELTLASLDPRPDDRVLEVGFGGGDLIARMLPVVSEGRIVGADFSQTMVDLCSKRFATAIRSRGLELHCASVDDLPFESDSFSGVCTVNTIYFWPDPAAALVELSRVLRPDGRLVISFSPRSVMQKMPTTDCGFTLYESDEVRDLLATAGFVAIETVEGADRQGRFVCAVCRKSG